MSELKTGKKGEKNRIDCLSKAIRLLGSREECSRRISEHFMHHVQSNPCKRPSIFNWKISRDRDRRRNAKDFWEQRVRKG